MPSSDLEHGAVHHQHQEGLHDGPHAGHSDGAPASMMQSLSGQAGAALVQRKLARRVAQRKASGARLQLQAATQDGGATEPKAAWPDGPTSKIKSTGHTLADYLTWLRAAEAAYGGGKEAFLQRLRRLYYSGFTKGAGGKFDSVISTSHAGDAPMTSPPMPKDALDRLFETNYITTPAGTKVDISHVLAALDLAVAGTSFKAGVGELVKGVDFRGVLTWSGDLASWFVEWQDQLKKTEDSRHQCLTPDAELKLLLSLAERKVSKDDLVGDMDGQAMAQRGVQVDVLPNYMGGPPAILMSLKDSVSGTLEAYYGDGAAGSAKTRGSQEPNRFANFLDAARPMIPHTKSGGKTHLDRGHPGIA